MIINNVSKVQVTNTILYNNSANAIKVDCNNVHWVNNSATLAFANFPNLTTVSNIGNTVVNAEGMFYNCNNLVNAPTIPASVVNATYIIKDTTYYAYDLDPAYDMWGTNINTLYSREEYPSPYGWTEYYYIDPDTEALEYFFYTVSVIATPDPNFPIFDIEGRRYNGSRNQSEDIDAELPDYEWEYQGLFENCSNLTNMPVIENNITDISYMFRNCTSLVNTTTIPNSVTNMTSTFDGCSSLTNMPTIPNSVVSLVDTFQDCENLVNITTIPNGVTNMSGTFRRCYNLETAPVIPNSVTEGYETFAFCRKLDLPNNYDLGNTNISSAYTMFYNCSNLTNTPIRFPNTLSSLGSTFANCSKITTIANIPENVTFMYGTFSGCTNLTGNIFIYAKSIFNANSCFLNTSLTKNVYIPFTYENGVNTATYNAFTRAGYTSNGSKNGVYLKNINSI